MVFRLGFRLLGFRFGHCTAVTVLSVLSAVTGLIAADVVPSAGAAGVAAGAEAHKADVVVLGARDLNLINRITWGANPSSAQEFAALGADKFLERQLHPPADAALPHDAQAQIDALSISHTPMQTFVADMDQQGKTANAITDPVERQGAQKAFQDSLNRYGREAAIRSLLRDLYSPYQLREQLTWFWLNHFNVHLYKSNIRLLIGDYEDKAIRPHALRHASATSLAATLRHPAMLRVSRQRPERGRPYQRELCARAHGASHHRGGLPATAQNDVQELARILTGAGRQSIPAIGSGAQAQARAGEPSTCGTDCSSSIPAVTTMGTSCSWGHTIKGRGLAEVGEAVDLLSARARHRALHQPQAGGAISCPIIRRAAAGRRGWRQPSGRPTATSPPQLQDHVRLRPSSRRRSGRTVQGPDALRHLGRPARL